MTCLSPRAGAVDGVDHGVRGGDHGVTRSRQRLAPVRAWGTTRSGRFRQARPRRSLRQTRASDTRPAAVPGMARRGRDDRRSVAEQAPEERAEREERRGQAGAGGWRHPPEGGQQAVQPDDAIPQG
jgi:hypothetical protein